MNLIIENNKQQIIDLCKQHHVKELYVFGSVTRDDFNEDSDIDFLYKIDIDNFEGWDTGKYDYTDNLLDFEVALTALLHRKVDLVPYIPIQNKYLKQSIEESKQLLYAA